MAIALAKHFNTSIISADSRQCFKELTIGVAKPSVTELESVRHYFINSHSVQDKMDAALFENFALQAAAEIFRTNPVAIMVGGTGMYIRAFCEGLDSIPAISAETQEIVRNGYAANGIDWLRDRVAAEDPQYYGTGEIQNPHRLMRALEVIRTTGNSIRSFQNKQPVARPFNIVKTALELPRPELNERIHHRIDRMVQEGLLDEVKSLQPYQQLNALQTVGYKEIFDHLNGLCSLDAAIEFIKTNTSQYAKRQMTWFKKDTSVQWFNPGDLTGIMAYAYTKVKT